MTNFHTKMSLYLNYQNNVKTNTLTNVISFYNKKDKTVKITFFYAYQES